MVVGLVVAGSASAVSVSEEDVTDGAQVGETVTVSVTLDELYRNPNYESWSVAGETELENVTWTVEYVDQTGEETRQVEVDGQYLNASAVENPDQLRVDADTDTSAAEVRVQVTGDVPPVEEYTYPGLGEDGEPESFLALGLTQDRGAGGTANSIDSWSAVHYTQESREARRALDGARETVAEARDAGADVSEAEENFGRARAAYREENFELAVDLATDAEESAQSALDAQQSGLPTVLVVGAVVVVLALAAVGVYVYRQRQEPDTKLR
ncbi:hypothetical protein BRD18_02970 [Halobacteriales archaeon SW_7_71_33]|nr:MAG: hypothetical protein BRD18_02970 [Halobacteriales archaeon SW_7_71_33]